MNLAPKKGYVFNVLSKVALTMAIKEEKVFKPKLKYVIVDSLTDPLENSITPQHNTFP